MALVKLYAVSGYSSSYSFSISEPGLVIAWYGWSNQTEPASITINGAGFSWGSHQGLLAQVDVRLQTVQPGSYTVAWNGISGYRTGVLVIGGHSEANSVPPKATYAYGDTSSVSGTISLGYDGTFVVLATRFTGNPSIGGATEILFSEPQVIAAWRASPGALTWSQSDSQASIIALSLVAQKTGGWVMFF